MRHLETHFSVDDGLRLFRQEWVPDREAGRLVLVHGFGEHSGRYEEFVQRLTAGGWGVYTYDLRGHGRSDGRRGHISSWADFRNDLHRFVSLVPAGALPTVLLGHSMGGLIVLDYLVSERFGSGLRRGDGRVERAVLSSPLLESPKVPAWRMKLAGVLSRFWPSFSMRAGLDPATLSRREGDEEGYRKDPLVHGIASARLATELAVALERVWARMSRLRVPLLVCHGDADRLVPVDGSRRLANLAGSGLVELKEYPGAFHELHTDLVREQYFEDLLGWLGSTGGK